MALQADRTELAEFRITEGDMVAFREISGDNNPLHHDSAFAQSRGFADRVVYGGLIVARISQLLGTRIPGPGCVWRSLSLRFRAPLYVGEKARIAATIVHANEELGLVELKLRIDRAGQKIAEGDAAAILVAAHEPAYA